VFLVNFVYYKEVKISFYVTCARLVQENNMANRSIIHCYCYLIRAKTRSMICAYRCFSITIGKKSECETTQVREQSKKNKNNAQSCGCYQTEIERQENEKARSNHRRAAKI
jgi:hypothetical protein